MRSVVGRAVVSLVVGLSALVLASSEPHGRRVAAWFGNDAQPGLSFAVSLPDDLHADELEALEDAWRARLAGYGMRIRLTSGPRDLEIDVRGATEAQAGEIRGALTVPGRLEFVDVVHDTEVMRLVFRVLHDRAPPDGEGVVAEPDYWRHDESGREFTDYYVRGPSAEAIERALAEVQRVEPRAVLPPGQRFAFEAVTPPPDAQQAAYVRSYVVAEPAVLVGGDVADAVTTWSPYSNAPEVLVTFDDDGARRFADYTREHTGHKLAILVDGEVTSAPVIASVIAGGQATIAMGAGDPAQLQAQAEALAAVLKSRVALPPGITAKLTFVEEPSPAIRWAIRLGVALAAALAAWLLATLIARRTVLAPMLAPAASPRAAAVAVPAALTAGLLALAVLLERVPLPWLADWVPEVIPDRAGRSILALGINPVLTAFVLVELVALAIPSWRRRRLGTPVDRVQVDRAVAWLAVGLAAVQAYALTGYLQATVVDRPALTDTLLVRLAVTATLVGGVMVYAVIAAAISRAGLINGWLALYALGAARILVDQLTAPAPIVGVDPAPALGVVAALGVVVAIALVVRRAADPDRRRLPLAGIAPLLVAVNLLAVVAIAYVATLPGIEDFARWFDRRSPWFDLGFATVIAALWAARRGGRVASPFAVSLSVAAIAFLGLLPFLLPGELRFWALVLPATVAVALVELAAGIVACVRLPGAVPLIAVHDVDRADRILDALRAAAIPAAATGLLARALYRFFGPFLPVVVRVPAARLDEATTLVARLGPG